LAVKGLLGVLVNMGVVGTMAGILLSLWGWWGRQDVIVRGLVALGVFALLLAVVGGVVGAVRRKILRTAPPRGTRDGPKIDLRSYDTNEGTVYTIEVTGFGERRKVWTQARLLTPDLVPSIGERRFYLPWADTRGTDRLLGDGEIGSVLVGWWTVRDGKDLQQVFEIAQGATDYGRHDTTVEGFEDDVVRLGVTIGAYPPFPAGEIQGRYAFCWRELREDDG
jgi:hypothetical protein